MKSLNNLVDSNPCMKCGSVQCAICSVDLVKEIRAEIVRLEEEKEEMENQLKLQVNFPLITPEGVRILEKATRIEGKIAVLKDLVGEKICQ